MPQVYADGPTIVGDALEALVRDARRLQVPLYEQWVLVYDRLADLRNDSNRAFSGHLDANVDLILRAFENEQAMFIKKIQQHRDRGALFLQISLSKSWLLTSYELLRTTCDRKICENGSNIGQDCGDGTCFGCRVLRVKRKFSVARMPLAKLEPEGYRKTETEPSTIKVHNPADNTQHETDYVGHGRYHPDLRLNHATGSLAWSVYDKKADVGRTADRRDMSDMFIGLATIND